MNIARHQASPEGTLVPVLSVNCALPDSLSKLGLLYVDLRSDKATEPWNSLLNACDANLGVSAPAWLSARDSIRQFLQRNQSVNLVVTGQPKWRELIHSLRGGQLADLGLVDLNSGATASRRGLIAEILSVCDFTKAVPPPPEDLVVLDRAIKQRTFTRLALSDFDRASTRHDYDIDLFASLRHLIMDARKLTVLIQSRKPFLSFLPPEHPLSSIDIRTVELKGHR